jgi:MazG family protein
MSQYSEIHQELTRLLEIVKILRGPKGCEWDRAQTSNSLSPYFLEEAHEVLEAIQDGDSRKLKDELGDLLLHIVFQAQIAEEQGQFNLLESIRNINDKLIRRHPHVFGDVKVANVREINQNWEEIKLQEGRQSLMDGLPKTLPALLLARRIQERASQVGFDWENVEPVWDKIEEELEELKEALKNHKSKAVSLEFGDLLFSLVNLSRFININPEEALYSASKKFIKRFKFVEQELAARNRSLKEATLTEMDEIWDQIRANDNQSEEKE